MTALSLTVTGSHSPDQVLLPHRRGPHEHIGRPLVRLGLQLGQGGHGFGWVLVQLFLLLRGLGRTHRYQPAFAPGRGCAVGKGRLQLAPGPNAVPTRAWRRVGRRGRQEQGLARYGRGGNPLTHQIGHPPVSGSGKREDSPA